MKNLLLRTLTGILYVACMVGSLLFCTTSELPFIALMLIVGIVGIGECNRMLRLRGENAQWLLPQLTLSATILLSAFAPPFSVLFPAILAFPLMALVELFRKTPTANPLQLLSNSLLPLFWIGIPLLLLCQLAQTVPELVLALFIIIWLNDTLAYCAGRLFGKHKLCERISPKKTIEGFVIAAVLTVALSVVFYHIPFFNPDDTSIPQWMGFAIIVVLFGTAGDLVESMLKRTCGVKDSGNILPGHGGILDRFDSVLIAAAPAALYCYLVF